MKFWKMHGAGNDFILLDNRQLQLPADRFPQLARHLCERRLSLGADGLMVVEHPQADGDYRMLFYNADGSLGEMCGNGARCICRYGYENGLAGEIQRVETTAGLLTGQRIDRRQYRVRLQDPSVIRLDETVEVNGKPYSCSYVELGNPGIPHVVVPMPNLRRIPQEELFALGRTLRYHPAFPKGANVNFYDLLGPNLVYERTWERGVEDFTYACGTGTGSLAAVLTLQGKVSAGPVQVDMTGGRLVVDVRCEEGRICDLYLTGPTNIVAMGELTDEDLPK